MKSVEFAWTPGCQEAFERLRKLLTGAPVLTYPDFRVPFILETDASIYGLGAVLVQAQSDGSVPIIAHASRNLQEHKKCYGVTKLEGMGSGKLARWGMAIQELDVWTFHRSGKFNMPSQELLYRNQRWREKGPIVIL